MRGNTSMMNKAVAMMAALAMSISVFTAQAGYPTPSNQIQVSAGTEVNGMGEYAHWRLPLPGFALVREDGAWSVHERISGQS
jgi:hypothetical protein